MTDLLKFSQHVAAHDYGGFRHYFDDMVSVGVIGMMEGREIHRAITDFLRRERLREMAPLPLHVECPRWERPFLEVDFWLDAESVLKKHKSRTKPINVQEYLVLMA